MARTTRWLVRLLGVVALACAPLGIHAEEPDFAADLNRAREVVSEGPAKVFYDGPFSKAFYAKFSDWLNQCSQQTGGPLEDLDLIVSLGQDGKVLTIRFAPDAAGVRCFAERVKQEQFPSPPKDGLTVPVSVRMGKS